MNGKPPTLEARAIPATDNLEIILSLHVFGLEHAKSMHTGWRLESDHNPNPRYRKWMDIWLCVFEVRLFSLALD